MVEALDLLPKYFSGGCNEEERLEVDSWIKKSADNEKLFVELKEIWEKTEHIDDIITLYPENAWNRIKQETGIKDRQAKTIIKTSLYINLLKIAASILILISIGAVIKLNFFGKPDTIIVSTNHTQKQEIHLPDGSVVYLNQGSQLKYPEHFETKNREIELIGEAFFQVAKDSLHPFIVHTNGSYTKVLGTSFNINAKKTDLVYISVFSGKVVFSDEINDNQKINLTKGENGTFSKSDHKIIKQIGDNENTIAWKTGILRFNKTNLNDAAKILSDYYSQTIIVAPKLQSRLISVTLNNQPLDKMIEILKLTLDIKADITSQKIILSPNDL